MDELFIIDGYMWIHRAWHAAAHTDLTSPSGEPTGATNIFVFSLLKLIREQEPDMLVVAMEGGYRTFRRAISDEYKANRTAPADSFIVQRNRIEQILNAMNIPVLRAGGYEADDIIGTVARRAQLDGHSVVICSKDKDMLQLVDKNIQVLIAKTGEYIDERRVFERTGVTPAQFVDYLSLQGDSSDNILGIPGIGGKTAASLLSKYHSIENIIDHLPMLKGRCKTNLLEFRGRLPLNRELITIDCDAPVENDYDRFRLRDFNEDKLREIFTELGFKRLMIQLDLD